ncbi:MAG: VWA domain-containing protein [Fibrobacteria bacterium]|nr:VWA domain-containing protein [Fibrobacteria bacterium]
MKSRILPLLFLTWVGSGSALGIRSLEIEKIKGPSCLIVDSAAGSQFPLAPFFTRVNTILDDGVAQATMIQSFANPLDHATEIAYVFPLPERGAVHAMSYQIHDSLFRATIQEKERAQEIYDSIRKAGGSAAILIQERPNVFQQKMASVGPHDTVHVEIKVLVPLKYVDGSWELAFPTMVGERYSSEGASPVVGTLGGWNPPEDRSGPGFQFNITVGAGLSADRIESPTHPLRERDFKQQKLELALRGMIDTTAPEDPARKSALVLEPLDTYPNRDLVLRVHRASKGIDAIVTSWKPAGRDTGFFHMVLLPDLDSATTTPRAPLDVILLVDRSGSQSGWPMDREKEVAQSILSRLGPTDQVTVMAFDDVNEYALGRTPVPATAENVAIASRFVGNLDARGGTQLRSALQAALAVPLSGDRQRLIVLLTDGFITDEAAILDDLERASPAPQVLTFGCGGSLNRYLLESAAAVGGGFATILTATERADSATAVAWGRIESPQVQGVRLDFASLGGHDLVIPQSDRLYRGLPLEIDGKYLDGGRQSIVVRGQRSGESWSMERDVDLIEGSSLNWGVPRLWARSAISRLELQQGISDDNKDSIVALSTSWQILSKYTAFLAAFGQPVEADASLAKAYQSSQATEVRRIEAPASHRLDLRLSRGILHVRWGAGESVTRIRILGLDGRIVRTLEVAPGAYEATWNGTDDRGARLLAGTWIVEIQSSRGIERRSFAWIP